MGLHDEARVRAAGPEIRGIARPVDRYHLVAEPRHLHRVDVMTGVPSAAVKVGDLDVLDGAVG